MAIEKLAEKKELLASITAADLDNAEKVAAIVAFGVESNEMFKEAQAIDNSIKSELKRIASDVPFEKNLTMYDFGSEKKVTISKKEMGKTVNEEVLLASLYDKFGEDPAMPKAQSKAWELWKSITAPKRVLDEDLLNAALASGAIEQGLVLGATEVKTVVAATFGNMTALDKKSVKAGEITAPYTTC